MSYYYYSSEAKHSFGRIMEILCGAKYGVRAFGYNSTESEHCDNIVGGWTWHILGAIRAVATV